MHAIAIAQNNATASSAVRIAADHAKEVFHLTLAASYTNAAACSGAGRAGQQEAKNSRIVSGLRGSPCTHLISAEPQ